MSPRSVTEKTPNGEDIKRDIGKERSSAEEKQKCTTSDSTGMTTTDPKEELSVSGQSRKRKANQLDNSRENSSKKRMKDTKSLVERPLTRQTTKVNKSKEPKDLNAIKERSKEQKTDENEIKDSKDLNTLKKRLKEQKTDKNEIKESKDLNTTKKSSKEQKTNKNKIKESKTSNTTKNRSSDRTKLATSKADENKIKDELSDDLDYKILNLKFGNF